VVRPAAKLYKAPVLQAKPAAAKAEPKPAAKPEAKPAAKPAAQPKK
jgi:hypothetical protein